MNAKSLFLIILSFFIIFTGVVYASSNLMESPKNVSVKYIVYGHHDTINTTLYGGVYTYFNNQDTHIYTDSGNTVYMNVTNDTIQDEYLEPFIKEIKSKSNNPEEQARIAINLVQRLDYYDDNSNELQYPYEVLYTHGGVCSSKSVLLALLLKKIGYDVALLGFDDEGHMAVGLKTDPAYAYKGTGYAFIETTKPEIITFAGGSYPNPDISNKTQVHLTSQPQVIQISSGMTFTNLSRDFADGIEHYQLSHTANVTLSPLEYYRWKYLVWYYGVEFGDGEFLTIDPETESVCPGGVFCNNKCWDACKADETPVCDTDGVYCGKHIISQNDGEDILAIGATLLLITAAFWIVYEAYLK